MGLINKKLVVMFIIVLFLSTNLFKIPSTIFKLLHIPVWMILYIIVPLSWILFVLSLVDFKKLKGLIRKNKEKDIPIQSFEEIKNETGIDTIDLKPKKEENAVKLEVYDRGFFSKFKFIENLGKKIDKTLGFLIEYLIMKPFSFIWKILRVVFWPVTSLLKYLNEQRLKIPVLRDFTANTFIVIALILLIACPFALIFGKEKLAEKLAEFAYFGLVIGIVGKFTNIINNLKKWSG